MNKPMNVPAITWDGMTITIELVTPDIAAAWLTRNTTNRRIRQPAVNAYAKAMIDGNWQKKPVAICFDSAGNLCNGQHTLSAIVASGIPQELMIARDVPDRAIAAMDTGLKRTVGDVAHFLGVELPPMAMSVARVVVYGTSTTGAMMLFDDSYKAYADHREAIDWVLSVCGADRKNGLSAPVLAVCVRASYTRDRNRIAEFIRVLKSGVSNGPQDAAATRLRDFLLSSAASGEGQRKERYYKTESALDYFLRYQPMGKLYGTEKELYPIPA